MYQQFTNSLVQL